MPKVVFQFELKQFKAYICKGKNYIFAEVLSPQKNWARKSQIRKSQKYMVRISQIRKLLHLRKVRKCNKKI
jgi:hypothetical protein